MDVDKQTQQVESFIEKGVNIIIINPVDANSQKLIKALKKAKKAGIKIVVVDSQLSDDSSVDTRRLYRIIIKLVFYALKI